MYKYKISVIVPIYNTSKYIVEALNSLTAQTFTDFEVIFIDDGSTDNSGELVKDYIKKHNLKNMQYIYQENSGPSVARNKGLDLKRGEYICFMDSDDKIPSNALELMYTKMVENHADIVIGGTYRFNSEKEWKINSHFLGEGFKNIRNSKELIWTMGPCNKMFKSELLENIRFPINLSNGEDQCFVLETYLKASNIYAVNELVYYYRERDVSDGSLTSQHITNPNYVLEQAIEMWEIISKIIDCYVGNKYERDAIKELYLNRMININVWGPLKSAIDSKDSQVQVQALAHILNLLKNIDSITFNKIFVLHRLCTAWIIDRYLSLSQDATKVYVQIIKYLFAHLNNKAYVRLVNKYPILVPMLQDASKASTNRCKILIKKYLLKRKIKKVKKLKIDSLKISLRNPILRVGGAIRSVNNNKVILASNKRAFISDNLSCIEARIKEVEPNMVVNCYPNKKRNLRETIKMYWDFSNAKNIVLEDYHNQLYNAKLNKNINVIQLWHACGAFKKFGISAVNQFGGNTLSFEKEAHMSYTHIITSSQDIIPHYAEAFGVDEETKVLSLGVPRTDIFFDEEYIKYVKETVGDRIPVFKDKKVIAYTPTFRVDENGKKKFELKIDFDYWCKNISDEYVLALKLHPSVAKNIFIPEEYRDKIIDLSKKIDIQDLLITADILITDYSSVIFEFSLMNKPMVFFAYDLDSYMNERDFYYEYEDFVPGEITKTTEELLSAVINASCDEDKLKKFKNKFLDSIDGKSTDRIVDLILNK